MNLGAVIVGILLIMMGIVFTFITLGFGIICSWPVIILGLILFIVGLVASSNKTTVIQQSSTTIPHKVYSNRYCPGCGRNIPNDANICPYCGKNFDETK
jgi:hypothetical protein